VTLEIAAGEMIAVTGHSGAGKSTLLKLAAGIERASTGTVVVNGQNLGALGETALAILRRRVGFIFQDHKLLYDRSCHDNVALPLRIAGVAREEVGKRVRAALDKVGLLDRERAMPVALSGGEQQRLCIARAIVNRPSVLIADEPTGNLDAGLRARIVDLFVSFNQVGVTVLLSTMTRRALGAGVPPGRAFRGCWTAGKRARVTWLAPPPPAFGRSPAPARGTAVASALSSSCSRTRSRCRSSAAIALRSLGAATSGVDTDPHVTSTWRSMHRTRDVRRIGQALRANADSANVRSSRAPRRSPSSRPRATWPRSSPPSTAIRCPTPSRSRGHHRAGAHRRPARRLAQAAQGRPGAGGLRMVRAPRAAGCGSASAALARMAAAGTAVGFIVGHLIRLQVLTHAEEIEVSQLLGATAADVRRPFLHHGVLQGLLAGAVAVALGAGLAAWISYELAATAPSYATELKVVVLSPMESLAVVALAAAVGLAGAWIAVARELRRFSAS
jgi:cell division transport system ATP-binding protein